MCDGKQIGKESDGSDGFDPKTGLIKPREYKPNVADSETERAMREARTAESQRQRLRRGRKSSFMSSTQWDWDGWGVSSASGAADAEGNPLPVPKY